MLTLERSHCMFDPSICWLRSSMVLCDLLSFKMYLLTLKVILFLQRNII